MPTMPCREKITNVSEKVINAIRNESSVDFKNKTPYVTPDTESLRNFGAIIMDNPALRNEFINSLVNRIALRIISSKFYENPLRRLKKGKLELGETVEEIFIKMAEPFIYCPEDAETTLYKRYIPDVLAQFHVMNYQYFYPFTIQNDSLRTAFLSWQSLDDFIGKIVEQMYTADQYDEYQVMKYMIGRKILQGMLPTKRLLPQTSDGYTVDIMRHNASIIVGASNALTFKSPNYNIAKVPNQTSKAEQVMLIDSDYEAIMGVDVLATSFNLTQVDYMGNRIIYDGLGNVDFERLELLLGNDANYIPYTQNEIEILNSVKAVLMDEDFMQVYDKLNEFTENYNGKGLYWNYFYHVWKIMSVSAFSNVIVFTEEQQDGKMTDITYSLAMPGMSGSAVVLDPRDYVDYPNYVIKTTLKPRGTGIFSHVVKYIVAKLTSTLVGQIIPDPNAPIAVDDTGNIILKNVTNTTDGTWVVWAYDGKYDESEITYDGPETKSSINVSFTSSTGN